MKVWVVIVVVIIVAIAYEEGVKDGVESMELQAIEMGAGEYYINEDLNQDFRWLDCQESQD